MVSWLRPASRMTYVPFQQGTKTLCCPLAFGSWSKDWQAQFGALYLFPPSNYVSGNLSPTIICQAEGLGCHCQIYCNLHKFCRHWISTAVTFHMKSWLWCAKKSVLQDLWYKYYLTIFAAPRLAGTFSRWSFVWPIKVDCQSTRARQKSPT